MRTCLQRGWWLLLAGVLSGAAGETPSRLRQERLDVVCSRGLFRDVSVADAMAAGRVWVSVLGRRHGYELQSRVDVISGTAEIGRRVQAREAGLLMLDALEYLALAQSRLLEPLVVVVGPGREPLSRYAVLASRSSGVKSLAELRGKGINVYSRTGGNLGRIWLETALEEKRLGRAGHFFSSVTPVTKPSAACLPVFFGKAAACVIDMGNLSVMGELNPQLGKQLVPLATSPPLAEVLVALHVQHQSTRLDVLRALLDLDRAPEGRQVLTLFKASRMAPFSPADFEPVRELIVRYRGLVPSPSLAAGGEHGRPEVRRP
jgi:ABC-type phosphate/phosphonate transport system substrate-binding protein